MFVLEIILEKYLVGSCGYPVKTGLACELNMLKASFGLWDQPM